MKKKELDNEISSLKKKKKRMWQAKEVNKFIVLYASSIKARCKIGQ